MDDEPQHMPHAVLAAAIPVLLYSFFCLSLGVLLVNVLHKTRDGFNCEPNIICSLCPHLLILWKMLHYLLLQRHAPL